MNEVQLIRGEIAGQRRHAREVAASWSSLDANFYGDILDSYNSYFLAVLDMESARIESHLARLQSRSDLSAAERALLGRCAREFETLAAARVPAPPITPDVVAHNANVSARLAELVEELEAVAQSRYGVDDWRRTAHVDADSILQERRLRNQALGGARGPASG